MEKQVLTNLAKKLCIHSESVVRKAEEYMYLIDVRSGSSSLAVLRPSGASKAAMCLELAANSCGEHVDRTHAIRVSGMTKKLYTNALRALQCLLDLQPNTSVAELAVQFGVTQAKGLALQVIQSYEKEKGTEETDSYSKALFHGAALVTACRRMKLKIDKNKLVDLAGVKKTTLDRLVALLDKQAAKILTSDKSGATGKRTRDFLEQLADSSEPVKSPVKKARSTEMEDNFEVWKQNILEKAYAALGKKYKPER